MSQAQPVEAGPFRAAAVDLAGPTQSIQIARTLMDRYAELMRDANGVLGLGPRNVDRMELIIGEASQIYPEIWANLDAAHAALTKRAIEVPEYLAIRGTGSNGSGVLDVEVRDVGIGYRRHVEKSATFDAAGNARARQASEALRRAMPTVDWQALDQKDAAMMADVSLGPSLGSKVVFYAIAGVLMVLVVAGLAFYVGGR